MREQSEGSMEWRRQQNADEFGVRRLAGPSAAANVGRRFPRRLTRSERWLLGGPVVFSSGSITKKGRYSWKLPHRSLHDRQSRTRRGHWQTPTAPGTEDPRNRTRSRKCRRVAMATGVRGEADAAGGDARGRGLFSLRRRDNCVSRRKYCSN